MSDEEALKLAQSNLTANVAMRRRGGECHCRVCDLARWVIARLTPEQVREKAVKIMERAEKERENAD